MFSKSGEGGNPIQQLRNEVDRLLGDWVEGIAPLVGSGLFGSSAFPALNIWEDEGSLYAEAEVPGLKMEDIEILVSGRELTVKGQRKQGDNREEVYHRRERGTGAFSRVIRLPVDVDSGQVEATLASGVLTLKLPKAEAARLRKIQVKCL